MASEMSTLLRPRIAAGLLLASAVASCQVISGLEDIEISGAGADAGGSPAVSTGGLGGSNGVGGAEGAGGAGGAGGTGNVVCEEGFLDRNRDAADGCEYKATIPTPGLALWLSADFDVHEAPAGGVERWLDQSSRRNDFGQNFPNNRPSLLPTGLNGNPAVFFGGDGSGDRLQSAPFLFVGNFSAGFTFSGVVRRDAPGNRDTIIDMVVSGGEHDGKNIYMSQRNELNDMWFGSEPFPVSNVTVSDAGLYTEGVAHLVTIVVAPGKLRFRFDGVEAATVEETIPILPPSEQLSAMLGANIAEQTETFHAGLMAELIIYERALDDGELSLVEQTLQDKWECCN